MINKAYFDQIFLEAIDDLKFTYAPRNKFSKLKHPERKVTDNLKANAIKYRWVNENTFEIYVDLNIAPYMPYTNERWISPQWNGTQNPNESWWNEAIGKIVNYIAQRFKGELK